MYQFVDRDLDRVDSGSRFLVWSMRAWVTAMTHRTCPAHALAPAFAHWRMIGGLQAFHRTMLMFNRDALETLAMAPLACAQVSEHEALILSLIVALSQGDTARARATLVLMVQEEAVGDLLESLSTLGATMALAGIFPGTVVDAREARN